MKVNKIYTLLMVGVLVLVEDWGQATYTLPYTTYLSDWAKINVNSPYW